MADGRHADGIDHLLVELGIAFRRAQAVLSEEHLVIEVDWVIDLVGRGIDVDHFEILADRAWH